MSEEVSENVSDVVDDYAEEIIESDIESDNESGFQDVDDSEDNAGSEVEESQPEVPKGVTKKINKEVRRRKAAEARLAALEKQLSQAQAPVNQPASSQSADILPRDKFGSDEEYFISNVQNVVNQQKELENSRKAKEKLQRSLAERDQKWDAQVEKAEEKYDDYHDVESEFVDIIKAEVSQASISGPEESRKAALKADAVAEALSDSKYGADIAYYLGKNPDKAERIASLPMGSALREIGKIEAQFIPKPKAKASKNIIEDKPKMGAPQKVPKIELKNGRNIDIKKYRELKSKGKVR